VHTPGHAKDLTCFFLPQQGYFFSGDLFIARKLKMLRSDENLEELVQSIQKVLRLDFDTLFCPHGGVIKNGKAALQEKLDNILNTCDKAQTLNQRGLSLDEITQHILGPEDLVAKLTGGNFCKTNLIRQGLNLQLV
jgi:glyoxylase-like metal-dependent hydrolase (beta-lactamase superfamily II)